MTVSKDELWVVIGAGMGGKGLVGQLGAEGFRLRLHDISEDMISAMRVSGGLHISGRSCDFVPLELVTSDLGAALDGAKVILVSTYGTVHAELATQMAPHLREGQIIVLFQGNFAGAHLFRRALEQAGAKANILVAEMDAYPYSLAIHAPDRVEMLKVKAKWQIVASPVEQTAQVLQEIGWAFPGARAAASVLNTGFTEMGGMFHSAAMVTNVGRVEDANSYNFYATNMVPSVCKLLEKMDAERVAVAAAYSVTIPNVRTWLRETFGIDKPTLHEALQQMAVTRYRTAPAPKSLTHRYLVQDVGCILVPISELGRVAGVPTPATDTVIAMADLLTDREFRKEGRNLKSLGWAGKTVAEIAHAACR